MVRNSCLMVLCETRVDTVPLVLISAPKYACLSPVWDINFALIYLFTRCDCISNWSRTKIMYGTHWFLWNLLIFRWHDSQNLLTLSSIFPRSLFLHAQCNWKIGQECPHTVTARCTIVENGMQKRITSDMKRLHPEADLSSQPIRDYISYCRRLFERHAHFCHI